MRLFLTAVSLAFVCGPAHAARVVQYGNRAGQEADIVSASGLSTAHALMRARITRKNAEVYCREQEGKVTPKCVSAGLSVSLKHSATANCPAHTFTDFNGNRWRFAGPRSNEDGMPKFRLMRVETGEEADGSMASGYGIALGIFRALCRKQAPPESAGY